MKLHAATRYQLETALEEIILAMYACRDCGEFAPDECTLAANSAADLVDAVDSALRNQNLVPDETNHAKYCEW